MKRTPKFETYRAADGWRWRLVAANGEIVASGEAYSTHGKARRAVAMVQRLVALTAANSQPVTHPVL